MARNMIYAHPFLAHLHLSPVQGHLVSFESSIFSNQSLFISLYIIFLNIPMGLALSSLTYVRM